MRTRGAIWIPLLIIVGLAGGSAVVLKPKWLFGDTKRAATSAQTTDGLITASDKKAAVAAASVVKIGEANSMAPNSPEKTFIAREVPVALASLPPPDAEALIAAEKRKSAVLEGRLQEADKLYGDAMKRADELQKELARAIAAKRASDNDLAQVAAERLGAERTQNILILVAVVAVGLYLYVRFTFIHPGAIATAVTDMRNGTSEPNSAIAALDSALSPLNQKMVKAHALFQNLASKLTK